MPGASASVGFGPPPAAPAGYGPPASPTARYSAPPTSGAKPAGRPTLGVLLALAVALVGGLVYALYVDAGYRAADDAYATLGWLGVLIGIVAGALVGALARNRLVPQLLGAGCALFGALFGELFGTVLSLHTAFWPALENLLTDPVTAWLLWNQLAEPVHYVLMALAPLAAIAAAQAFARILAQSR